jgi:hypothetical protein
MNVQCPVCEQQVECVKNVRADHFVDDTRFRCPGANGAHLMQQYIIDARL